MFTTMKKGIKIAVFIIFVAVLVVLLCMRFYEKPQPQNMFLQKSTTHGTTSAYSTELSYTEVEYTIDVDMAKEELNKTEYEFVDMPREESNIDKLLTLLKFGKRVYRFDSEAESNSFHELLKSGSIFDEGIPPKVCEIDGPYYGAGDYWVSNNEVIVIVTARSEYEGEELEGDLVLVLKNLFAKQEQEGHTITNYRTW